MVLWERGAYLVGYFEFSKADFLVGRFGGHLSGLFEGMQDWLWSEESA